MTDQDAAAHPPSLFTSLKTTDIHTNTPYDATRMPTRLQRMSQLFNETHITVAIFDSESPLGYSTMTDQDAAARPPSLSTSLKTTEMHPDTPYDATRMPTRLQGTSPLCKATHNTVAIFDSETPLGYSTMTDQDAAAHPPSLFTSLKTTDIHTDTPYDATRMPTRLQRTSQLFNETHITVAIFDSESPLGYSTVP
jgi:hypothetical protein